VSLYGFKVLYSGKKKIKEGRGTDKTEICLIVEVGMSQLDSLEKWHHSKGKSLKHFFSFKMTDPGANVIKSLQ
jgi:hypothetical protein